jgi:hypothetical protein
MTGTDPLAGIRRAVANLASGNSGGVSAAGGTGVPNGFLRVTIVDDSAESRRGLDRIFDAFDATIEDLPAVLLAALPTIREAHRAVFDTEGAAGRGSWAALSPVTIAERKRLGFGAGPILLRTGALRAHVLAAPATITRGGGSVSLKIEPDANVGGVPKYAALAKGTSRIPPRPMAAIGPPGAAKVTSAIQRALRARAQQNGLR